MTRTLNVRFLAILLVGLVVSGAGVHFLHAYQVRRNAKALLDQAEKDLGGEEWKKCFDSFPDKVLLNEAERVLAKKKSDKKSNLVKTSRLLSHYLALNPQDDKAKALVEYGLVLESSGNRDAVQTAFFVFERVIRLEPKQYDIRRKLARMTLGARHYTDGLSHLDILYKDLSEQLDIASAEEKMELELRIAEIEQMRGQAYEATADSREEILDKAKKDFANAIRHAPHQIESYESLARLLRRHPKNQADANKVIDEKLNDPDNVMDEMIKNNRESDHDYAAFLARARYRMEFMSPDKPEKDIENADYDIEDAYNLAPDNAEVILAYAEMTRDQGNLGKCRRVLEHGLELDARNTRMYQDLAAVELLAKQPEEAKARLRSGLEHLPNPPDQAEADLLWTLANLLIDEGKDASDELDRMEKVGVLPAQLDYLQARVQFAKEEWSDAARLLEQAQPDLAARAPELAKQANLLLAKCYGQLADWDQQSVAYDRVLKRDPFWLPACLGMGSTLTAMGKIDDALEIYRRIMPQYPRAMLETARLLIVKNLNLGRNERRWGEIDNLLERAKELFPIEVTLLRAEKLIAQEQLERAQTSVPNKPGTKSEKIKPRTEAQKLLHDKLAERPRELALWLALADLAERQGEPREALEILDQAERQLNAGELQNTDRVNLLLARVQYWGRRGDDVLRAKQELTKLEKQALATLGPVESSQATTRAKVGSDDPTHPTPLRWKVLSALANAHLRLGDRWEAQRLLEQLAKEQPKDLGVRLALFDIALEHGLFDEPPEDGPKPYIPQPVKSIKEIEEPEAGQYQGSLWRYAQIRYLIWLAGIKEDDKCLDQATELINAIAARRPSWSRVPLGQALIEDARQKLADNDKKNYAQAIQYYLQAIKAGERGLATIRRAFQLLCQNGQYAEANDILDKLPDQAILTGGFQHLAAQILTETGQFERGISLAQDTVNAYKDDYRYHLWFARLLWKAGKTEPAKTELQRAKELEPKAPEVWVALVLHLARTGHTKEAEVAVNEAKAHIPSEQAPLALAQCYEALGHSDQAGEQLRVALRARPEDPAVLRIVAAFYLRIRDPKNAQTILQKLIDRDPQSPDALWASRSLAIVLAAQGDSQQAQRALKMLDEHDTTSEGLRARALVLMAQREHRHQYARKAIADLEEIIARPFPTPDDRFLLAQLYNTIGEWTKARDQMMLLSDVLQDSPAFLAYFVKSLIAHREAAAAGQFLARLEKMPALDGTAELAEIKASFLAENGNPAAARDYLEKMAKSKPDQILLLISFVGRQGKVTEALNLCREHNAWQRCPTESVANACLKVLHDGPAAKQDLERVEEWVKAAMAKEPKSATALTVCLADLRDLQGRYREAKDLYRQALDKDPHNVVALNNLAWLLAFEEGQGAEALKKINQAIEIAGPMPALLDTQGMAYLANGKLEEAVQAFEQAMEDEPTAAYSFHLARAQHMRNKDQRAVIDALTKAKSLGLKEEQLHALDRKVYQELKRQYPALFAEGTT